MSGGLGWFKSSYSDSEGSACIEVASCPCTAHVRDSKLGARSAEFGFEPDARTAFVRRTAEG
jgi:hypothetical protein